MLYGCLKDALLPPRSALCSGVVRCVSRCVSRCVPLCPVVCSVVSRSLPLSHSPSLSVSLLLCRGVAVGLLWGCCGSPPFQFLTCPGSAPLPIIPGAFPRVITTLPKWSNFISLNSFSQQYHMAAAATARAQWVVADVLGMPYGCLRDVFGMP